MCPGARLSRARGDNLMVHAAMASLVAGDVLVLTMPEPEAVALVGDLLATQAKTHGAAAILVDAAVRDVEELVELGLPIWTRHVSIRGATKDQIGALDEAVTVGGQTIEPGDVVVLDADGVAVVARALVDEVLEASLERERREAHKRAQLQAGALSYDLDGLRERVEGA
jgi:4-hydroxy-4-methyl-2-oxoglutarate aldolase